MKSVDLTECDDKIFKHIFTKQVKSILFMSVFYMASQYKQAQGGPAV